MQFIWKWRKLVFTTSWKLQSLFVNLLQKNSQEKHLMHELQIKCYRKLNWKRTPFGSESWKIKIRAGVMNVMQLITSIVRKFQLEDYLKTERFLLFSIGNNTLIELGYTENIRCEKFYILHLPLEIDIGTSKLTSQNLTPETYDSKPKVLFTPKNFRNTKVTLIPKTLLILS